MDVTGAGSFLCYVNQSGLLNGFDSRIVGHVGEDGEHEKVLLVGVVPDMAGWIRRLESALAHTSWRLVGKSYASLTEN